jgi:Protoglobin
MALDPHVFMSTLEKRVGLTDADKALLKSEAQWGSQLAPEMAEHFYAYLGRDPEMNNIVNGDDAGRVHRLRETFIQWFQEMFTGMDEWGNAYADRRWRIGLVHVRLGIGPQHVVPAMATVVHEVGKRLKTDGKSEELKDALGRICMIDLAFIEQAYVEVSSSAVLQETGWSEGLFRRLIATGAKSL